MNDILTNHLGMCFTDVVHQLLDLYIQVDKLTYNHPYVDLKIHLKNNASFEDIDTWQYLNLDGEKSPPQRIVYHDSVPDPVVQQPLNAAIVDSECERICFSETPSPCEPVQHLFLNI